MESKYNITISDASKDGEIVKFTVQTKTVSIYIYKQRQMH